MSGRTSAVQRIERYADAVDARLSADEQSATSMRVFTDSSLRRVLKDCGYEKRGSRNLHAIQQALLVRGVHPDPPLTTPGLAWDQRIYFTRTPPTGDRGVERVRFPAERDLEDFLEANFNLLFSGMKLVGRQYEVQSGKIDMLARDADGYVVIELKKGRPGDRLVNQLPRYMDDVSDADIAKGGTGVVRGLVVASALDSPMHGRLVAIAAQKGRRIDWWQYRIEFEMEPAPPPMPWSEPVDNGEPWTEVGIVNPQSPALARATPFDESRLERATASRRFDDHGRPLRRT